MADGEAEVQLKPAPFIVSVAFKQRLFSVVPIQLEVKNGRQLPPAKSGSDGGKVYSLKNLFDTCFLQLHQLMLPPSLDFQSMAGWQHLR